MTSDCAPWRLRVVCGDGVCGVKMQRVRRRRSARPTRPPDGIQPLSMCPRVSAASPHSDCEDSDDVLALSYHRDTVTLNTNSAHHLASHLYSTPPAAHLHHVTLPRVKSFMRHPSHPNPLHQCPLAFKCAPDLMWC